MDNKSDQQFLIIQATAETNKQEADEKQIKVYDKQIETDENFSQITETLKVLTVFMMYYTNNLIS